MLQREQTHTYPPTSNKWYVAYTHPQVEKKLHKLLSDLGYESFLPLSTVQRQWSDRIKTLEVPLFPSYLFIKTTLSKLNDLLSFHGLSKFISFDNKYATLKDIEVERIKTLLVTGEELSVFSDTFSKGQEVVVESGPLAGFEGILVEDRGRDRIVMELKGLKQRLSVDVPVNFLSQKKIVK